MWTLYTRITGDYPMRKERQSSDSKDLLCLALAEELAASNVFACLLQVVEGSQVAPVCSIRTKGGDFFTARGEVEIGLDDRERSRPRHHAEQSRRDHMNAAERKSLERFDRTSQFGSLFALEAASTEEFLLIE